MFTSLIFQLHNGYLRGEVKSRAGYDEMVGKSDAFKHILGQIEIVVPRDATAVLQGENGQGVDRSRD